MAFWNRLQPYTRGAVRRLLLSWLMCAALCYLLLVKDRSLAGLSAFTGISVLLVLALTAAVFCALSYLASRYQTEKIERWGLFGAFTVFSVLALFASYRGELLLACLGILLISGCYGLWGHNAAPTAPYEKRKDSILYPILAGVLACTFCGFVSVWTVYRVKCFWTPSYDFGIFSQMFYNMKETGLPMTTLERDGLLSHFQVHVSPTYYLMLPFYCILPRPETLQVLQGAVLASSILPLWKLGSRKNLPGYVKLLLCALLVFYPAFSGGTSYDLHENCFLTPLLLWLLYGLEKGSTPITAIAAVLTLGVKEDAPVYVAVVGLYWLLQALLQRREHRKKELLTAAILIAGALAWFLGATAYLAAFGDGVMTYRYENFMYDGSRSLFTVVKAVLMNPMKALYECVDGEKLTFIRQTMLPLLFLPLATRRFERYILLIPYVLVNLMSDYTYQHDIFFQYTFGSTALLFYLVTVNVAEFKANWGKIGALCGAVLIAASTFFQVVYPQAKQMPKLYKDYEDYYKSIAATLDTIPDDAPVAATTFYTVYLSSRPVLYDVKYCSREHLLEAQYVALNVGSATDYGAYATDGQNGYENLVAFLEKNGYSLYASAGAYLTVFCRNS